MDKFLEGYLKSVENNKILINKLLIIINISF